MILFLTALLSVSADFQLPDPKLTPGVVSEESTVALVCKPGYTKKIRNVTEAMKTEVVKLYTSTHPDWPKCKPVGKELCEIDHLISLELGGSNDIKNLWPEKYCPLKKDRHKGEICLGAREKDEVENELHREVCIGKISLSEAQDKISADWVKEYYLLHPSSQN